LDNSIFSKLPQRKRRKNKNIKIPVSMDIGFRRKEVDLTHLVHFINNV
jgi:hypothetical protein